MHETPKLHISILITAGPKWHHAGEIAPWWLAAVGPDKAPLLSLPLLPLNQAGNLLFAANNNKFPDGAHDQVFVLFTLSEVSLKNKKKSLNSDSPKQDSFWKDFPDNKKWTKDCGHPITPQHLPKKCSGCCSFSCCCTTVMNAWGGWCLYGRREGQNEQEE